MKAPEPLADYTLEDLCVIATNLGLLLAYHTPADGIFLRFKGLEMFVDRQDAQSMLTGVIRSHLFHRRDTLLSLLTPPDDPGAGS